MLPTIVVVDNASKEGAAVVTGSMEGGTVVGEGVCGPGVGGSENPADDICTDAGALMNCTC
jgi:hypothetical protein